MAPSKFDPTIVDIWEEECHALAEFPEGDRLIGVQADDLLALIHQWRKSTPTWDVLDFQSANAS
jgi:hypothetical protein